MEQIRKLILHWKLNQVILAEKMGMPVGTFKTKFSKNQKSYKFTEQEQEKLLEVMQELGVDISNLTNNDY